jgi:hypothetical protein
MEETKQPLLSMLTTLCSDIADGFDDGDKNAFFHFLTKKYKSCNLAQTDVNFDLEFKDFIKQSLPQN